MKRQRPPTAPMPSPRRGSAIVFALVALFVASLMIASLLRTASMSHRQLLRDEFRTQAHLLADAGGERALAQLRKQPDFTDEVWTVPADQLGFERTAVVRLKVITDPVRSAKRIVAITAEYPAGNPDVVRVSRELIAP